MALTKPPTMWRHPVVIVGILLLLALVLVVNAWVVDDAYITFRTVDNFVHGGGLTWNTGERVQAYTHPLWMLVVTLLFVTTSELFFTVIVFSILLSIASVVVAWATATHRFRAFRWKGPLLVLSLVASKAFIDYTTSGLENPMSYLIASVFLLKFMSLHPDRQVEGKDVATLFFLASLALLNRPDTILLYLPALLYVLYLSRFMPKRRVVRLILVATLPATLWGLFALIYYGYPFPNTVYAKVLSTGFPFAWKVHRGFEYLANSILWDTASYVVLGGAVWFSLRSRSRVAASLLVGIALYMSFTVCSAASATHMSGRFFAVPFFVATVLFVNGVSSRRFGAVACACLAAYIVWSPISAVKFGTAAYRAYAQNQSYIDTKWHVLNEGAALINWRPGKKMPDHSWYHYGEWVRRHRRRVHVGGAFGGEAIGYAGYAAGPTRHLIDTVGLGDPLLGRFPADRPDDIAQWKSGHFHRRVPDGYVESLARGRNLLREPGIRRYYDLVRVITRGPVFSWERFKVAANMNLGRYEYLLAEVEKKDSSDGE